MNEYEWCVKMNCKCQLMTGGICGKNDRICPEEEEKEADKLFKTIRKHQENPEQCRSDIHKYLNKKD